MERQRKLFLAKGAVVLGAIPFALWAYEYGPDPGHSGVPGEAGSCAAAGCHTGTANNPANKGSVKVTFPDGLKYSPGVTQQLSVTVADPAATQQAYGFQLTARLASNPSIMAGSFVYTDANTLLMCSQPNLQVAQGLCKTTTKGCAVSGATTCPSGFTLQYMEHSYTGYLSSLQLPHTGSYTYTFNWTPPSTNVGDIVIYVAGNAGVGGAPSADNDHIYTNKYTLSSFTFNGTPAINAAISAGAFGAYKAVAPGSWIEIYGDNLAAVNDTRGWVGSDFNGNTAPTSLDTVQVTIGGKPCFIDYISNGQVNAQVPSDVPTGAAQNLVVTTGGGTSAPYSIDVNALQPGLLAIPQFVIGGKQYVVAQHSDGTYVLPSGTAGGSPAKAGETVIIYGVGFGPVNPSFPAGQIVTAQNSLTNSFSLKFGSTNANLGYSGLSPNYVGLYQFNVVVPAVAANSAVALTYTLNGSGGPQTLYTAVQ